MAEGTALIWRLRLKNRTRVRIPHPVSRCALTMVAEFEADLNRQRTLEGIAIARAQGRMRGKPPKLNERRTKKLLQEHESGTATVAQLAEDYNVSRATVYRTINRARAQEAGD